MAWPWVDGLIRVFSGTDGSDLAEIAGEPGVGMYLGTLAPDGFWRESWENPTPPFLGFPKLATINLAR